MPPKVSIYCCDPAWLRAYALSGQSCSLRLATPLSGSDDGLRSRKRFAVLGPQARGWGPGMEPSEHHCDSNSSNTRGACCSSTYTVGHTYTTLGVDLAYPVYTRLAYPEYE